MSAALHSREGRRIIAGSEAHFAHELAPRASRGPGSAVTMDKNDDDEGSVAPSPGFRLHKMQATLPCPPCLRFSL